MQLRESFIALAKVYELLEAKLRGAAINEKLLTLKELVDDPAIAEARTNEKQVVNAIATLRARGHLVVEKLDGTNANGYKWNLHSGPFVVGIQKKVKAEKLPGKPVDLPATKPHKEVAGTKEVELAFGDTLVIIGRNAATGRLRLVLEDIGTV